MSERTPLPWTPSTILHLALAEDIDFAVCAVNSHAELLEALENLYRDKLDSWAPHLDTECDEEACRYMREARAVIAKAKEESP